MDIAKDEMSQSASKSNQKSCTYVDCRPHFLSKGALSFLDRAYVIYMHNSSQCNTLEAAVLVILVFSPFRYVS